MAKLLSVLLVSFLAAIPVLADPQPGYYDSVDVSSLAALRTTLHQVIDGHQRYPYTASSTDTWDILNQADEDPLDSSHILDLYRNRTLVKYSGGNDYYNREHTWPNSYGFPDDNSNNYPYTDCHHLMLCDISYNSFRGSNIFDDCTGGCSSYVTDSHDGVSGVNYRAARTPIDIWETWDGRKGDVARAMFYMDVRYEGDAGSEPDLILTDDPYLILASQTGNNEPVAYMGLLSTLVAWHEADPVDDKERRRNDVVEQYQHNRNPFVDHPEWVDLLFGDGFTPVYEVPTAAVALLGAAPNPFNPATSIAFTLAEPGRADLLVYGLDGKLVRTLASGPCSAGRHDVTWRGRDDLGREVPSGAYVVRLRSAGRTASTKVMLLE
ncbi:MAG: endonuclease [Candidatus Krumholzibacteriia bacterium]